MSNQLILAMLVTCVGGYTMICTGLANRVLSLRAGGRCPSCGRLRHTCSCEHR